MLTLAILQGCDNPEPPFQDYFVKYFGDEGNQEGVDMIVNSDGTYYLAGNSTSRDSSSQIYLVKADAEGNLIWQKKMGTPKADFLKDIEYTTDGRLVLVANTQTSATDTDILLMTLDLNGNEINRTIFGYTSFNEDANSVSQVTDGFIVAGSTDSVSTKPKPQGIDQRDAILFRFYDNLAAYANTWGTPKYGPGTFDVATKIFQVSPNEFHVFGYSNRPEPGVNDVESDLNFWIFNLSNTGVTLGKELVIGSSTPTDNEVLTSVAPSPVISGAGYILVGTTTPAGGARQDVFTAKLNTNLTVLFSRPITSAFSEPTDSRTSVFSLSTSGYVVLATRSADNNNGDLYLKKIDNEGGDAWTNPPALGFGGLGEDKVGAVAEATDGRIVLVGTMGLGADINGQKKLTFIKVNKEGKFLR